MVKCFNTVVNQSYEEVASWNLELLTKVLIYKTKQKFLYKIISMQLEVAHWEEL